MSDLKIDFATGDIMILNGDFVLTDETNGEATQQRVWIRLQQWRGEWFLDTRLGVRYRELVLVKNPNLAAVEAEIRTVILETKGVARILSYSQSFDRRARTLTVSFAVEDVAGNTVTQTQEIPLP